MHEPISGMSKTKINFNKHSKDSFRNTFTKISNSDSHTDPLKIYNHKTRTELDQAFISMTKMNFNKKHLTKKSSPINLSTRDDSMHSSVVWNN